MATLDGLADRTDVRHTCPWCGGAFAEHLGAFVVVQSCWACHGAGTLSADELSSCLAADAFRQGAQACA
jgi:DnaJ-class molecular chaperone